MTLIALLPIFIAAFCLLFKSPAKTMVLIYIPSLLLLPQAFEAEIVGLPNLTFAQSALIPIALMFLFYKAITKKYRTSQLCIMDLLVISFIFVGCLSEYTNQSIEIGNLSITFLWKALLTIYFPYVLAKNFAQTEYFTVSLIKTIILCLVISVILAAYEWRFHINFPLQFLESFFPGQGKWTSHVRFGLVRIAGPYYQTISFGIAIAITLLLNHWFVKNHFWRIDEDRKSLERKYLGYFFQLILFIGLLMTLSRGPLLGACVGFLFVGLSYSKTPKLSAMIRFSLCLVLGFVAFQFYHYYSEIDLSRASSRFSGNVIYRIQLFKEYIQYIKLKPFLGWGAMTLPSAGELESIDNQFLYVALRHGLITLAIYTWIIVVIPIRLFLKGWNESFKHPQDKTLMFTLNAIFLCMIVSFATVYMGNQIPTLFFLLTGLSEGHLQSSKGYLSKQLQKPLNTDHRLVEAMG